MIKSPRLTREEKQKIIKDLQKKGIDHPEFALHRIREAEREREMVWNEQVTIYLNLLMTERQEVSDG